MEPGNRKNGAQCRVSGDLLLVGIMKRAVFGKRTSASSPNHCMNLYKKFKGKAGYGDQNLYNARQFTEGSTKNEEFFCYNENDFECEVSINDGRASDHVGSSTMEEGAQMFKDVSVNVVEFLKDREDGNSVQPLYLQPRVMDNCFHDQSDVPLKHLLTNQILHEKAIKVENMNKVFCSQWLSDRQVIFGTKCNKLVVLDVQTKHTTQIPNLNSSPRSIEPDIQSGIHSIEINPSRTLLATGGKNPNDIAVYQLPTLDPVCVGEVAHQETIFSTAWLDDQFIVSGSRDTTLALWKIPEPEMTVSYSAHDYVDCEENMIDLKESRLVSPSLLHHHDSVVSVPSYKHIHAVSVKQCRSASKIRDLVFNRKLEEIACVSMNGYIHVWSAERFTQKYSRKLPFGLENVCVAIHEDYNLYAVGSKSHTTLLDARTIQSIKKIPSKFSGYGIRSLQFFSSLLSLGTGCGCILTYDLRSGRYLESSVNSSRTASLKCSPGWTYPDEDIMLEFYRQKYTPAVYTHCIDMSATRIFSAGGPLPVTQCGNYIGVWH